MVFFQFWNKICGNYAGNETSLWQAGKYPPPTMPIQNIRQLTCKKILKHRQKNSHDQYPHICLPHSPIPGRQGEKRNRKARTKEK